MNGVVNMQLVEKDISQGGEEPADARKPYNGKALCLPLCG